MEALLPEGLSDRSDGPSSALSGWALLSLIHKYRESPGNLAGEPQLVESFLSSHISAETHICCIFIRKSNKNKTSIKIEENNTITV